MQQITLRITTYAAFLIKLKQFIEVYKIKLWLMLLLKEYFSDKRICRTSHSTFCDRKMYHDKIPNERLATKDFIDFNHDNLLFSTISQYHIAFAPRPP